MILNIQVREMAARDREKTKNMKKEYEEMKGAILSELMPSIKESKKPLDYFFIFNVFLQRTYIF